MKNIYSTFPYFKQPDVMDCGPTCLRMIAKHYGKTYTLQIRVLLRYCLKIFCYSHD